jgi:hypothetical protein
MARKGKGSRHAVNGKRVHIPMDVGSKQSITGVPGATGVGPTPHSSVVAYAKAVHHNHKPSRGTTRTLSR